ATAANTSLWIARYWAFRSTSGTCMGTRVVRSRLVSTIAICFLSLIPRSVGAQAVETAPDNVGDLWDHPPLERRGGRDGCVAGRHADDPGSEAVLVDARA